MGPSHMQTITLRARWIVPISSPPIENGFVEIAAGRIVRCGPLTTDVAVSVDLGDVAILPGLVNAHTHLEFSDLAQPIGHAGMELADWIVQVIQSRATRVAEDNSIDCVVELGAMEAVQSGTALIGEIATTPWQMPRTDVGIVSYAEVLGLTTGRATERWNAAVRHLDLYPHASGISPHAPYSAPPELISRCVDHAIHLGRPLAMHVAESPAERELLQHGSGPLADQLSTLGLDMESHFPWASSDPFGWLIDLLARAPAASIIHGNNLSPAEIERVASHPTLSVVYCPRTHAYFGHAPHPVADLAAAGVNVGLGTDSRASNPDLQLWREVQFLLNHRQDLSPHTVLRMATYGGAAAMLQDHDYGTLLPGRLAAFASVPTTAHDVNRLYADLAVADASQLTPL